VLGRHKPSRTLETEYRSNGSERCTAGLPAQQTRRSMRVLVDTNIFLDVLLDRPGLADESEQALNRFNEAPALYG